MEPLSKLFGKSKQAYYKRDEDVVLRKAAQEAFVVEYVHGIEKVDLIHHSDRGVQYASSEYIRILREYGIRISMTESGDPKENAQAERINNTMKNELLKGKRFTDIAQVRSAVAKAVDFYNRRRPHMSINMMTPAEAAFCEGVLEKWWVSYREKAVKAILEKQSLEDGEKSISLSSVPGSPSGLRPPVNPGTR